MTKRLQQLAMFLSILVIHGRVLFAQQSQMSGRFYQQQMNYMNRHMACEDDLVGTPRAPERPNATFGVVSDDFALAAKPILEAVIQLRQYPQTDNRFYDLADQINTMLLPMPEAVHYFPDAITCGFLSELYGSVIEFKAQYYRDKSVRLGGWPDHGCPVHDAFFAA